LCLGRCGSCDLEHRQMDDGWGLHFVRRTRKSELIGRNQSPVGTLGSKTQELVAPSGCCLVSGIDTRRSERVGSRKQGYNDQTHFCPPFFPSLSLLLKLPGHVLCATTIELVLSSNQGHEMLQPRIFLSFIQELVSKQISSNVCWKVRYRQVPVDR